MSENESIQYSLGYQDGFLDAKKQFERTQGEWIGVKSSCDIGHKFYVCSVCSRGIDLFDSETLEDYPFCHCGAAMRGDKNDT